MDLVLEGKLAEHSFPRILNYLYESGETGRLEVLRNRISKTVYLVMGSPVNVDSNLRDETLGQYLIRQGKITEEECDRSVEMMMEKGIQQGAALVKMGCLKPKELYHAVKSQTQEKVLNCFAWVDGDYRYESDTSFVEDLYRFEMSFPQVMREGVMRFFPKGALEHVLALVPAGPLTWLENYEQRLKAFKLGQDQLEFIKHIDGDKSFHKKAVSNYIISSSGYQ